jgi:hypothetical protein
VPCHDDGPDKEIYVMAVEAKAGGQKQFMYDFSAKLNEGS